MGQFPQLNQEDLDALDVAMSELLGKSEANVALLVEKAGYLIHQCGNQEAMDATTFAEKFPVVGRNEPCPCGSGKKFKFCHGQLS